MQAGGQALEEFTVRPWPEQRARRTRWIGLAVLLLAPIVATVITWSGVASDTTSTVVEPAGVEGDVLLIEATATNIDLQRNEMSFRLVFRPSGSLTDGTRLQDDVTLVVNDLSGATARTFDAGTVMEPTTVVVGLTGSQLRYPFDTYEAQLNAGAVLGTLRSQEPLPLDMSVDVALDQFTVDAQAERTPNTATVELEMGRRTAVIIWVLFFISLVWMIALSSAAIAWFIVVFAKDPPFWVYALFASILFALPTLRAGLPGSPPYGSLVDWAAFYWGIAIVAGGLIALMVVWNVEARVAIRQARRREDRAGGTRGAGGAGDTGSTDGRG